MKRQLTSQLLPFDCIVEINRHADPISVVRFNSTCESLHSSDIIRTIIANRLNFQLKMPKFDTLLRLSSRGQNIFYTNLLFKEPMLMLDAHHAALCSASMLDVFVSNIDMAILQQFVRMPPDVLDWLYRNCPINHITGHIAYNDGPYYPDGIDLYLHEAVFGGATNAINTILKMSDGYYHISGGEIRAGSHDHHYTYKMTHVADDFDDFISHHLLGRTYLSQDQTFEINLLLHQRTEKRESKVLVNYLSGKLTYMPMCVRDLVNISQSGLQVIPISTTLPCEYMRFDEYVHALRMDEYVRPLLQNMLEQYGTIDYFEQDILDILSKQHDDDLIYLVNLNISLNIFKYLCKRCGTRCVIVGELTSLDNCLYYLSIVDPPESISKIIADVTAINKSDFAYIAKMPSDDFIDTLSVSMCVASEKVIDFAISKGILTITEEVLTLLSSYHGISLEWLMKKYKELGKYPQPLLPHLSVPAAKAYMKDADYWPKSLSWQVQRLINQGGLGHI